MIVLKVAATVVVWELVKALAIKFYHSHTNNE